MSNDNTKDFPIIDERINIDQSIFSIINEHYRTVLIVFIVLLAISFFFLFSGNIGNFLSILILEILAIAWMVRHVANIKRHAFMQQFAKINNYTYQRNGSTKDFEAPYLQIGYSQYRFIEDVVTGTLKGYPIKLFNFYCTEKHRKDLLCVTLTVCEIKYKTELPRIFVDSHHNNLLTKDFYLKIKDEKVIPLEGDFNKYFTLYIPKGYQIEALQIFSPDIMTKLIDNAKYFDLEVIKDSLYIYLSHWVQTKEELTAIYDLAGILIEKLAPKLERLK